MELLTRDSGITVSYDRYGSGPPLVLVHGGFSDHVTNWQEVKAALGDCFTVYAVARRGRGQTTPTTGHSVDDEAADVAAVLEQIGRPAALLGHSYGALCALSVASLTPSAVSNLVLYEPPGPNTISAALVATLERLAAREDWDTLVETFLLDGLQVPATEVRELRASPGWSIWTTDAPATLHDLRALVRHQFDADAYRALTMPAMLLVGSESPREIYLTDALASVLADARIRELEGQAHEGMTTAPSQFVEAIRQFLAA